MTFTDLFLADGPCPAVVGLPALPRCPRVRLDVLDLGGEAECASCLWVPGVGWFRGRLRNAGEGKTPSAGDHNQL